MKIPTRDVLLCGAFNLSIFRFEVQIDGIGPHGRSPIALVEEILRCYPDENEVSFIEEVNLALAESQKKLREKYVL